MTCDQCYLGFPYSFCTRANLQSRIEALETEFASARNHIERLELAIWDVIDTAEGALRAHQQNTSPTGMQAPYHGEFANMSPSTVRALLQQANNLKDALRGMWPMTRSEFVALYPSTDPADLDRVFAKRTP